MTEKKRQKKKASPSNLHFGVLLVLEPVNSAVHHVVVLIRQGHLSTSAHARCQEEKRKGAAPFERRENLKRRGVSFSRSRSYLKPLVKMAKKKQDTTT